MAPEPIQLGIFSVTKSAWLRIFILWNEANWEFYVKFIITVALKIGQWESFSFFYLGKVWTLFGNRSLKFTGPIKKREKNAETQLSKEELSYFYECNNNSGRRLWFEIYLHTCSVFFLHSFGSKIGPHSQFSHVFKSLKILSLTTISQLWIFIKQLWNSS